MKKLKLALLYLLALPKSLYVCLRLCTFSEAIKLPIIVSHNTKLASLRGKATFAKAKTALVRIGFGSVETYDFITNRTILCINGEIHFKGKAKIGKASRISVSGILSLGENFHISAAGTIIVRENISFGNNCLLAWDSLVMDTDHHKIMSQSGSILNPAKPVVIGNHVWIGARSMILKGVTVPDNCVVGAQSLISKPFTAPSCLIAGNPAKVIKESIQWAE